MDWTGKRVLVTGAGGFIGSHLTERLVVLGADTRALVHYRGDGSRGWLDHSAFGDSLQIFAGDIRDRDIVAAAMREADVVFHLAALIAIPYSYQAPMSYVRTNVEGTVVVLQAARDAQVERLVHTSTSEVYGSAQYVPIDEGHPLQGQSPYSASKIAADKMAESFYLSFGLPVATVRPFNAFGPRQSARAVIPTIVSQALTEPALRLGSLTPTRDFNYMEDIVEGFILAAQCPEAIGQVINIGSGRDISIGDVARVIRDLVGRSGMPIESDEERLRPSHSEVERLRADNAKATRILGWRPRHTLEEGLSKTIDWVQANLERYRPGVYAV